MTVFGIEGEDVNRPMRILRSRAFRGVAAIASGTVVAQVITAASAPLVSRLFTPDQVGGYTVIVAVAAVLGAIASLRWELAIPVARDEEVLSIVWLGLVSALITSMAGIALMSVLGTELVSRAGSHELMPWLLVAPAIAGTQGCLFVLNQLALRRRAYGAVGRRTAMRAATIGAVQVGGGLGGASLGALVGGVAAGNTAASVMLLRGSGLCGLESRRARSRAVLRRVARNHRRSPLLLTPAAFINAAGLHVPVLMLAGAFGAAVAGWLGMTLSVLALPVALVSQSVGQVLLAALAEARHNSPRAYRRVFWKASLALGVIAGVVATVLVLVGPILFALVLGSRWRTSGEYAQLMAAALALQMLAVPLGQTLVTSGRQGLQLAWDSFRLAVVVGSAGVAIAADWSAEACILAYSLASAVAYLVLWVAAAWAVEHPALAAIDPVSGESN